MKFHSILFDQGIFPEGEAEQPDFFTDLNLDQVIDAIASRREEYHLRPFYCVALRNAETIHYRHEVMQDLEDQTLLTHIQEFADRMILARRHLARAEKLQHLYHREGWFLEAALAYCAAVTGLKGDLDLASIRSGGFLALRDYMQEYVNSPGFQHLQADVRKVKAGLLESPKRGVFVITKRGSKVLSEKPKALSAKYLERFPEFVAFRNLRHDKNKDSDQVESLATPEETLEAGYQRIRESLAQEILDKVKAASPSFFERLVVDLLVKMGYGGSRKDAGEAIGRSGDGGVDGIIKEDRLGLDILYIQAKRWEGNVSRPEIQKFVGALQGKHARKGIFLTTSSFSREAHEFVKHIETKIVLIDGVTLAGLMIDHAVGTSTAAVYEIKKVDQDYFAEL